MRCRICMTVLLLSAWGVLVPRGVCAQPPVPAVHAWVGARIILDPDHLIERGTLVLRDGVIEAVGPDVRPPADARIWKGDSLTIYPGLLEPYLAPPPAPLPPPRPEWEPPPPSNAPPELGPTHPIDVVRPERDATRLWSLDPARRKKLRALGFTAALMVPGNGVLRGTAAWIALSDRPTQAAVLADGMAECAAFAEVRGREAYPSSKMGNVAVLRQTFLDVQHRRAMRAFLAMHPGRGRLDENPALEALEPVLDRARPLLWDAVDILGVLRAARLTDEFAVSGLIMGSGAEYLYADTIAAARLPLILPVTFPDPPEIVEGEEHLANLELLRHWDRAPENPAILAREGVEFAFTTTRLKDEDDFPRKIRDAESHGLDAAHLLAALTVNPARMLGMAHKLGRIAPGMLAFLTITDGPLFADSTRVREVWIDGERIVIPKTSGRAKEDGERKDGAKRPGATPQDSVSAVAGGPPPPRPTGRPWDAPGPILSPAALLVHDATIWTCGPEGILEHADLLVRAGRITAVGRSLAAPEDALVIDASGKHVTPGIIDCHSHAAGDGDINEGTQSVTAEVRIGDVVNPRSIQIYRGLAGGVTTLNLLHGSANAIGGQNAVLKLRWGSTPPGMFLRGAPPGIKFALGENVKQSNWGDRFRSRYPQTRMGVERLFRERFQAARDYRDRWDIYTKSGSRHALPPPARDLELEALGEVLSGKRFVHCHAYRQDEMLMLMRVAEEFGFEVRTFQHALEAYKIANELSKAGVGASIFSDWWAYKFEVYDAIPYAGALLLDRGVLVSFNSDSPELHRRLNLEAAKAVKYKGVSPAEALKFVTINPAMQLGIDRWVGSLEPGKDADFVLWSGSPLSTGSLAEQTWIEGRNFFDRIEDQKGREAIAAETQWLIDRAREARKRMKDAGIEPGEPGDVPGSWEDESWIAGICHQDERVEEAQGQ